VQMENPAQKKKPMPREELRERGKISDKYWSTANWSPQLRIKGGKKPLKQRKPNISQNASGRWGGIDVASARREREDTKCCIVMCREGMLIGLIARFLSRGKGNPQEKRGTSKRQGEQKRKMGAVCEG